MSKAATIAAVRGLDLRAVRELLEAQPSLVEVTDRQGQNLLHVACSASPAKLAISERQQVRLVEFLLERGFEIDTRVGRDACTAYPTTPTDRDPRYCEKYYNSEDGRAAA